MDKKSDYKKLLRSDLPTAIDVWRFKHLVLDICQGNAGSYDPVVFNQAVVETIADGSISPDRYDAVYDIAEQDYPMDIKMEAAETIEDFETAYRENLLIRIGKAKIGITDINHKVKTTHKADFDLL